MRKQIPTWRINEMRGARNPVVDKQLLARDLRRLRDEVRMTQQEVAEKLGWSREKVGRIETAATSVSPADVALLLAQYGVTDQETISEFEKRAVSAQRPGWNEFKGLLPNGYLTYLGFEEVASTMRQYHLSLIPGLLQTRAYMQEVLAHVSEISPRDVRRLTDARLRRQDLLTANERPLFKIIIDEAALRRSVGGSKVMREQLERLQQINQLDGVHLMILPFAAGSHPGMKGAFNLLTFDEAPYDDLLYMETAEGDRMDRDNEDLVAEFLHIFEELESKSLAGKDFDKEIQKIAESFG
jgi:transcriptional regulator with XRE-family HTH domain